MKGASVGFSLVELLMAMALMVAFGGTLVSLIVAGQSMARMQPEAADLQQRARIALRTLGAELAIAGAGLDRGPRAGPLAQYFAPVVPSADGGITLWYASSREAQTALTAPLAPGDTLAMVEDAAALTQASTAIIFNGEGCRDLLRVDDVAPPLLQVRAGSRTCPYQAGASVAQGEVRTYRVDTAARQLLRRDEATGSTVPVLDHVTAMRVDYLDGGRRVRITLRLASALGNPLVPDLQVTCDVLPPNLQGR